MLLIQAISRCPAVLCGVAGDCLGDVRCAPARLLGQLGLEPPEPPDGRGAPAPEAEHGDTGGMGQLGAGRGAGRGMGPCVAAAAARSLVMAPVC